MESEMSLIVQDTPPWRYRSRSPPLRRNVNRSLFRRVIVAPSSDFEGSRSDPVVSFRESETVVPVGGESSADPAVLQNAANWVSNDSITEDTPPVPETLYPFEDSGTVETVLPFEDSTAVVPEMVFFYDSDMVVPEMIPPCDETDTVVQETELSFDFSQSFLPTSTKGLSMLKRLKRFKLWQCTLCVF
ncbi:hypothetical protein SASPL_105407 [Salvia splendens]|uniref:Uncharacterized protein n=1 Tax=Salvia splendens TaxID=180675 RepID=A0A8X8YPJ7_SALSN|nr:hypothetical protein SASPL_105407 [Salvia splendens]